MIAFAPYASRFNFEVWIMPKRHIKNITEFNEDETKDLADIMHKILNKLKELNASYNFVLHYSPDNENLHFHIEILPRFANWAGFEFGTDMIINSVSPEYAAQFFRDEL